MKLSELKAKPQLIEVTLDDQETIKEYPNGITFHTWDRQPMDVFLKLASLDQQNQGAVLEAVTHLILDEKGNKIIDKDNTIPTKIMMRVITKVVEGLGKF